MLFPVGAGCFALLRMQESLNPYIKPRVLILCRVPATELMLGTWQNHPFFALCFLLFHRIFYIVYLIFH